MPKFTHLHAHSHYSLLDGLAKIDDLVALTKELGMESVAITDHGVLYGAIEFYKKAKKAGVKPILGIETYVAPKTRLSRDPGERYYHLILLAENLTGWKNLIQLSTKAHLEGFYYKPRIDKEILREHHEGLIGLSACLGGEIAQALLSGRTEEAAKIALEYQEILGKGNYFLEIQKHPNLPESEKIESLLIALSKETGIPLVATQDLHYLRKDEAEYHDILLAVQTGNKLSDDDRLSMKVDDFSMLSPEEMAEKFSFVPEAITNTQLIAERCNLEIPLGQILLPHFEKPDGKTANAYLRELVAERIGERFKKEEQTKEVIDRIEYELGVIEKTGFADYFLIVQDLINWAKDHGISVGPGRGSAAGSLLSYILRITDINPLAYDLLFERFLNPDRIQMPDVDIDFADTRRDEVLAYAREKYGNDRVAQIITFGTMAARAAVRDAGRAMGLPYAFCDQVAKLIPGTPHLELKTALKDVAELKELYDTNADAKKLLDAATHLEGVARHASVHACGTVISKDPLVNHVPLQLAPQDKESIITQFEMHTIEDLGLLKIDFLGLRNLTTIQETLRLVQEIRGQKINISEIPLNDQKTFELLQAADNIGVFQFESSGMRRYMKDLKPTEFEDLIAMVALYRPGPLEMGMVPKYIARKHGQEKVTYLHPQLEPILETTYGIGVYQEQMMRIARDLAGFTLAEADTLRKAIGKKIKSLLDEQQEKIVSGMVKNGIDKKIAKAIWDLFPPFARYGFNKSHAACYALIGYQTAYLKAHYPQEFMASLLNGELNDIERIAFLVQEAKQKNIAVLPPDINKSFVMFTPEEYGGQDAIRFGLLAIKNVGAAIVEEIMNERARGGPYSDLNDFLSRVQHKDLNKKSLESLIKSGAFDSMKLERGALLFNLEDILKFTANLKRNGSNHPSLFGSNMMPTVNLKLKPAPPANDQDKLNWEKELLGFFLSDHPLNRFAPKIKEWQSRTIEEARRKEADGSTVKIIALVSKIQKITTRTGQPMIFAQIEDFSTKPLEVVIFNETYTKTAAAWKENQIIYIKGKINWRNDEPKMICENVAVLS